MAEIREKNEKVENNPKIVKNEGEINMYFIFALKKINFFAFNK